MSQKISQLPSVIAANISDTDIIPLVATNITSKVTVANLRTKLGLTGVSGDRGDANVALSVGNDSATQRFATALTANRTITLSTVGAWDGAWFQIVRSGLGAFTLDVGGLKTLPSGVAAYAEVQYSGPAAAWILVSYGTL